MISVSVVLLNCSAPVDADVARGVTTPGLQVKTRLPAHRKVSPELGHYCGNLQFLVSQFSCQAVVPFLTKKRILKNRYHISDAEHFYNQPLPLLNKAFGLPLLHCLFGPFFFQKYRRKVGSDNCIRQVNGPFLS